MFPCKYHQNGGFSMANYVSFREGIFPDFTRFLDQANDLPFPFLAVLYYLDYLPSYIGNITHVI